jgi:tRNA-binding protein
MSFINWSDFERVDLRVGTIITAENFPEARKAAYKITVDFGSEIGIKRTSAQVTELYSEDALIGMQIIGVVNFPPKQIGPFISEFLLTGFPDENGRIIIASVERPTPNGARLM